MYVGVYYHRKFYQETLDIRYLQKRDQNCPLKIKAMTLQYKSIQCIDAIFS